MASPIIHVGINADDLPQSRAFYERVLGWSLHPWGPPGFLKIEGTGLPASALQERRDLGGKQVTGFEVTVQVDDLTEAIAAALEAGGHVLMEPTVIGGVGELAWVADPAGNPLGLMCPEPSAQ